MEPHKESYELSASSSLSQEQLEVYRLYQMCGVTMSNEKFNAIWKLVSLNIPTSYIMDLLRDVADAQNSWKIG